MNESTFIICSLPYHMLKDAIFVSCFRTRVRIKYKYYIMRQDGVVMEEQAMRMIIEMNREKINDFIRDLEDKDDVDFTELIDFLKSIS